MIEKHVQFVIDTILVLKEFHTDIGVDIEETKYALLLDKRRHEINKVANYAVDMVKHTCSLMEQSPEITAAVLRLEEAFLEFQNNKGRFDLISMSVSITSLVKTIKAESTLSFYLRIGRSESRFYRDENIFGETVAKKFPKLKFEIANAGKCLALKQPTACVFHLMRVMEAGVKLLGRKLKVNINVDTENWAAIISRINGKIDQLPKITRIQQRKKAKYAEASTYLNSVRIAWRNEVMHPNESYTNEQAHKILVDKITHLSP